MNKVLESRTHSVSGFYTCFSLDMGNIICIIKLGLASLNFLFSVLALAGGLAMQIGNKIK